MRQLLLPLFATALGATVFSATAKSDGPLKLGERNPLKPPFVEVFDDYPQGAEHDTFDRYFQFINSDGDLNPSGSPRSWGLYNYNGEKDGRQYSKSAYLQYPLNVSKCDDWLIPRAIKLEAGKYYLVKMDASLFLEGTVHSFEVKMGEYNDAEGMTFPVIPETEITSIRPKVVQGWFVPEYDGLYYMGIHGTSLRSLSQGGYLFVDNIGIEAARSGKEPGMISDLGFLSDADGKAATKITFKAPDKCVNGEPLQGDLTITILRNSSKVKTITAAPGEEVEFIDEPGTAGYYDYSITVSNPDGEGASVVENRFVGMTNPLPPVMGQISEPQLGYVNFSWEAPATDLFGTPINPEKIAYNIYEVTNDGLQIRKSKYQGNEITMNMDVPEGEQMNVEFAVAAVINGLESAPVGTDFLFVGTPYSIPFEHHFTGAPDEPCIGAKADPDVRWRFLDDYSEPKAQDGDGGYICMVGTEPGQTGELTTGKISLTSATDPYVSFYTYVYEEDENELSVKVVDCATNETTEVANYTLYELGTTGWTRIFLPIKEFAGKTVRVALGIKVVSHGYIPLDNMAVGQLPKVDLAVDNVFYTLHADANDPYEVMADIANIGATDVESFSVNLICDGKVVDTVTEGPLKAFDTTSVILNGQFNAMSPEMPVFNVEVVAAGDENESNNLSQTFNITFLAPNFPVVPMLKGEEENNTLTLSWSAPDLSKAAPEETKEDFESYAPFSTSINGFTMIDADKGYIAGFSGVEIPVAGTQQAYWTMRSDGDLPFISTLGNSSLFTMATVNESRRPVPNDDWLISPELYGGRQTIGFMACSQSVQYGKESFEVYASSSSSKISDFKLVKVETEVGEDWTQFYVTLPEGSKYFAIRCTSSDRLLFTLDDITFIPKGEPRELSLIGYNVYKEDEKLNNDPIKTTTFVTPLTERDANYYVTAVYDKGESTASNVVNIANASISAIEAESAEDIYYNLNGVRISSDRLEPGIYIHRKGNKTRKIIVM
ncbi:MAG: choice-of-anchor J domain-containing protein [Muribaculaceae bacterium]|nr:choice-of-anchor J domain-containing protein [Muribaculaceae bacterium]